LVQIERQPEWLCGSQLHDHQLEMLNWLRSTWLQDKGGFLIGDPGQGKTATIASFLQCLREEMKCTHPMMLVVPSSRMSKWHGEINFWSGGKINTAMYQGSASARPVCLENEIWQSMECMDGRFPCRDSTKIPKPDVVLISSEIFAAEVENLLDVPWDLAVLDTRWLVKGAAARLANTMISTECPHFILASELPSSEAGLRNAIRLIDSRQMVCLNSPNVTSDVTFR